MTRAGRGDPADARARFADALIATPPAARVGLAVSGGPDSLALLHLAHGWGGDRIEAATVDHGLRAESGDEARHVGAICHRIGVPHRILGGAMPVGAGGLQASARRYRYALLRGWVEERGLAAVLTAHHADDQAETVLLRLARGAGLAGLSGIRAEQRIGGLRVLRPLLRCTKADLAAIVAAAGWRAIDDPSNHATRFDRSRARALLAATPWLEAGRIAAAADHLRQADRALVWAAQREAAWRLKWDGAAWWLDPSDLPDELLRRLVVDLLARIGDSARVTGPEVERLITRLRAGHAATLGPAKAEPGVRWRFTDVPPRRSI